MYGYAGKVLFVDLSSGEIKDGEVDKEILHDYIGGFGVNARLCSEYWKKGVDPLEPDNIIIIGSGFFAGTFIPSSSKTFITTKFPMTGCYGTAAGGGSFAAALKYAGYDNVIITGQAKKPIYISIGNRVEICDASNVWGKDIFEATDIMIKSHGGQGHCSAISIGMAGENGVSFSLAMIDKASTVGRGGLGAVMGSKKLKGVVASYTDKGGVKVADNKKLAGLVCQLIERARSDRHRESLLKGYIPWDKWVEAGFSYKNWSTALPEEKALALYDVREWDRVRKRTIHCYSCVLGDKYVVGVEKNKKDISSYFSSYANALLYPGVHCDISDVNERVICFDAANRYGVDIICFTTLVGFLVELYEGGILSLKDTGGLELKLGFKTTMELLDLTVRREGFGKILAGGISGVNEAFPATRKYSSLIKGMSPVLDPRNHFGTEHLEFVVNPRGPQIAPGESISLLPGRSLNDFKRYAQRLLVPNDKFEKMFAGGELAVGRLLRYIEDWYSLLSSVGVCIRPQINRWFSPALLEKLYEAVAGKSRSAGDLLKAGERGWNLLKVLNVKEGFDRRKDSFPENWFKKLDGERKNLIWKDYFKKKAVTKYEAKKMLDEYYEERGWNIESGIPGKDKLAELEIEDF